MANKLKVLNNSVRALYHYNKKTTKLPYMPQFLWLEPTGQCNLSCVVCPNSVLEDKKNITYMPLGLFKKIIDETSEFIGAAFLFLGGESFLHKDIFKMIRYAREKGIRPLIHTNATVLTPRYIDQIFESELDYISFSFDGYTKEQYEKVRVGAKYDKTITNILNFLKKKKELKSKKPYTVLQTLITDADTYVPGNDQEKAFHDLFKGLPIDEVNIRYPHNWGNTLNETEQYKPKELNQENYSPCSYLWASMSILANGKVVPCCFDFEGDCVIGDANTHSIKEIWNNDKMVEFRQSMLDQTYEKHCGICTGCVYLWHEKTLGIPMGLATVMGQSLMNVVGSNTEKYFKQALKTVQPEFWYTVKQ